VALVLASASPRRRELLSRLVSDFLVIPSHDEETAKPESAPHERVVALARAKALDVAGRHGGVILAADTLVVLGNEVLGKPRSRGDARAMLGRLAGREHAVLTGVCILRTSDGEERSFCEETAVKFRPICDDEIDTYLEIGEYEDKAGGYAIQGRAAAFVEAICGDYTNVIGLPLCRVSVALRALGVHV